EKHGADHYFTDLEAMANSEIIDCDYIDKPNSMNFEQTLLFLKNKKHVICEKPIFSNNTELVKNYKVVEANNVYLFEAMRNIVTPGFQLLECKIKRDI